MVEQLVRGDVLHWGHHTHVIRILNVRWEIRKEVTEIGLFKRCVSIPGNEEWEGGETYELLLLGLSETKVRSTACPRWIEDVIVHLRQR